MKRLAIVTALVAFASATATPARADLVDFTQLSFSPSGELVIGGVTITGPGVAALEGVGVGLAGGVGSYGTVDRTRVYNGGLLISETIDTGALSLKVDGQIEALTIMAYITTLGTGPLDTIIPKSSITYSTGDSPVKWYQTMTPFTPLTIHFDGVQPDHITDLMLGSAVGWKPFFSNYLQFYNQPTVTFQFGFAVTALEYTPTPVPEPATILLVSLASGGLALMRRRRSHPRRS